MHNGTNGEPKTRKIPNNKLQLNHAPFIETNED